MTWGVPLSVSYHFAFSYCSVLKARILKWFAIPFFSGPHYVRSLHHDLPILGGPTGMALFHWVRQGCGPSVIRLTSFLWVWFQYICPLMSSCNTYRLTWVSLTLDVGYLFMAAPAKRSCCSLPWTRGTSSPLPFLTFKVWKWQPHYCMASRRGKCGNSDRFPFLSPKTTVDGDCKHEIRRQLLLARKVMTNLESMLKSRDITLMQRSV